MANTNCSITFLNFGYSEMSFLGIDIILAIFRVVGSLPSVKDLLINMWKSVWLLVLRSWLFNSIPLLILEQYPSNDAVPLLG